MNTSSTAANTPAPEAERKLCEAPNCIQVLGARNASGYCDAHHWMARRKKANGKANGNGNHRPHVLETKSAPAIASNGNESRELAEDIRLDQVRTETPSKPAASADADRDRVDAVLALIPISAKVKLIENWLRGAV